MQPTTWISLTALIAAIVGIGLGIAALVLALDNDGPQFAAGATSFGFAPQFQDGQRQPGSQITPPRDLDEFGDRFGQALPVDGRPLLGINVSESDAGVLIDAVTEDGPAAEAGLEYGDLITAIDDVSVSSVQTLSDAINAHAPGDEISITIERDGETEQFDVTLAERQPLFRSGLPGDFERPDGGRQPFPGPGGDAPPRDDSAFSG